MASKPFGIQSPEQIAKDYGGNKQRIAEAMQLGIVDPTIGTLAGMFIDRMAAGAAQGQAPQGTVASQVFNPQTPPAQAPGGAALGGLPMGAGAPPPDMGMGMGAGAPPPDMGMGMGMGAPPPDMPMPPPSPEDMQPMSPGMADGGMVAFRSGGSSDDYRLPPMREERHNNLLELVRQFTGINQQVGDANIRGRYDPIRNTSDYGVDVPVAGGNFRASARSSRGFRPDSFSADYSHRLLGGDLNVGARHDRGGTSGRVGYTRKFADGGMVAFAQGGESRPLDLQSLLPFPEAGLPEEAGFADGGVASLPVPDDMFNSSVGDNQQYADGGMVAFAAGDEVLPEGPLGPYFEEQVRALYPDAIITGRGRTAARNQQVGGVPNSYHVSNNALDLKPPKGMSLTEFGSALRKHFGPQVDTIFNTKGHYDHVHLEPSKVARRGTPRAAPAAPATAAPAAAPAPAAPAGLAAASIPSEELQAMREQMRANAAERAADKKDRKQAGWAALAQRGLAMMSPQGAEMPSLFADGGVVRFAAGTPPNDPFSIENTRAGMARLDELAPQSTVRRDKQMAIYDRETSDEYYRTERKQSANMALMNFGLALMASKNPNFLGAIGEAGAPAVAGMKADLKDLKKQFRDATFEAAQLEGFSNKESRERVNTAEAGITRAVAAAQAERQYEEDKRRHGVEQANEMEKARLQRSATIEAAKIGAAGQADYMDKQLTLLKRQVGAAAVAQLDELRAAKNNPVGLANNAYLMAMQKYGAGKPETIKAYKNLQQAENAYVQSQVQLASGGMGAPSAPGGDGVTIVSATPIPQNK